ncbi:MAG: uroporphyrinogen-III synthase [Gammaproteobacteria bacterium]
MNAHKRFEGFNVLVTRPEHQADGLCDLIEAAGGQAIRFPTLEIRAVDPPPDIFSDLGSIGAVDWLVFISANAVYFALKACDNAFFFPATAKVAAIGQATAAALERSGIRVDLHPRDRFDSEALLELPELQSVAGQHFLIVRGRGGRETLAATLRARGAHVVYAEVYERLLPNVTMAPYLETWRSRGIDAVTILSGESLVNFVAMLGDAGMTWARGVPLVVPGARVAAQAERAGFEKIILAANATDWALFEALGRLCDSGRKAGFIPESVK